MTRYDVFGRSQLPAEFLDRRQRVALLRAAADALLAGELPTPAARLFLAGALQSWLSQGGNLERDFLRVRSERGSHLTPRALAQRLLQDDDDA